MLCKSGVMCSVHTLVAFDSPTILILQKKEKLIHHAYLQSRSKGSIETAINEHSLTFTTNADKLCSSTTSYNNRKVP